MELILKRIAKRRGYTIGKLYIKEEAASTSPSTDSTPLPTREGQGGGSAPTTYFCDTLEPTWRDYARGAYKVKGCSAIPEGRYPLVVTWSPKFRQWLPLLLHVPKFEGIRIHAGNSSSDTEGCILLGENREVGRVLNSRHYVNRLKRLLAARTEGEPAYITVC